MRILFDQGTPVPLRDSLQGHSVATAYEMNWSRLENGELLAAAERAGFELFNHDRPESALSAEPSESASAIIVLPTTRWPQIALHIAEVLAAISKIRAGDYHELRW